jgi:integrase
LLKPALDALLEQYEITGNNPKQQIHFPSPRNRQNLSHKICVLFFPGKEIVSE